MNCNLWILRYIVAVLVVIFITPTSFAGQLEADGNSRAISKFKGDVGVVKNTSVQSLVIEPSPPNSEFGNSGENLQEEFPESDNIILAQVVVPTLTITNNYGDEWDRDGNMEVNVSLSSVASTNVSFKYSIEDITTTKREDYTEKEESERTVTISAGTTSDSFTIPVINDALYEGNETFRLTLSNLVGANFSAGNELSQIFTIRDDEGPTINIANTPLRVQENVAGGKFVVTVKLSNPFHSRISFPYSIRADGSASASSSDRDFVSSSYNPLTFVAGETEQTIEIDIVNDDRKEANETFSIEFTKILIGNFTINYSLPDGTTSQIYSELVTIIDDESIQILADSFTIAEDAGSFRGKVILGTQPSHGFRATLEVRAGTATSGVNYSPLVISGADQTNWLNRTGSEFRLRFRTTPTNEFTFEIPIIDNSIREGNKTFELVLKSLRRDGNQPIGLVAGFPNGQESYTQTVTIVEDDPSELSLTNTTLKFNENDDNASLKFTISPALDQEASFSLVTTNGPSGSIGAVSESDFDITTGITNVDSGATTYSIPLGLVDDMDIEWSETFTITLSNLVNLRFSDDASTKSFTIKIIDDDIPVISVEDILTVDEDVEGGKLGVVVSLSRTSTETISVNYTTSIDTNDETEARNSDFRFKEGTLVFSSGQTEKTVEIEIINDSDLENTEMFEFTLSNITGTAIFPSDNSSDAVTIKIIDDDTPTLDITADSFYFDEDAGFFRAAITLSGTLSNNINVTFAMEDASHLEENERATRNVDYLYWDPTGYNFDSSTDTQHFTVLITNDTISEEDESINLVLYNLRPNGTKVKFPNGEERYSKTLTIVDDDSRTLSVSDTELSVVETTGSETGNNIVVSIELSKTSIKDVTFDFELVNGTAAKDSDFSDPASYSGSITAGSTSSTILIPIINDTVHEGSETFQIKLKNLLGAKFVSDSETLFKTITITDDDEPTLVIPATSTPFLVAEDSPNDQLILNLLFSKALLLPITATIETTSGTAVAGQDFMAVNGSTGAISSTTDRLPIPIPSINDTVVEGNESFTFRISSLIGAKFPDGVTSYTGTITIIDDESTTLTFTTTEFYVEEDVTGGNFDVNLSLSSAVRLSVTLEFNMENAEDRSALESSDYTQASNNTITFETGQTSKTLSIPIKDDTDIEGNESFTLVLSNLIGAKFTNDILTLSQEITIFDDDAPEVTIAADNFNVAEDSGKFTFSLVVDGNYNNFKFSLSTNHGTASGIDYSDSFEDEYTYRQDSTKPTLSVDITDDDFLEGDETLSISLEITEGAVRLPKGSPTYSQTVTIVDDESTTMSVKNTRFDVIENIGQGGYILRVGLSNTIAVNATVEYDLMDVSTTKVSPRSDYTEWPVASRKTTIPAGDTIGTFSIPIINDPRHEGNELFKIILKNPVGAVFADGETLEATITIIDDEDPTVLPPLSASIVAEDVGNSKIEVSMTLSGESARSVAVSYETVDDTAKRGEDYTYSQGVLNFSPGTTEATLSIPILNDLNHEGLEQFKIRFSVTIGDAEFLGGADSLLRTIYIFDDESPTLSIANTKFYVSEDIGSSGYNLEIALSGVPNGFITSLNYAVIGGTAVAGVDYDSSAQNIRFSPGEVRKTIKIGIEDNNELEENKTIRIALTNLSGAVFAGGESSLKRTITIIDDERTTFALSSTLFKVNENTTSGKFDVDVMLAAASLYDVSFSVSTQDGTAIKDQDYTSLENKLVTIEAGNTTSSFSIPIINDSDNEGDQTFSFSIENVVGAVISGGVENIEKIVTIIDDDAATIILDEILSIGRIVEGYGDYSLELETSVANHIPISIDFSSTPGTARSGTDYIAPANQTITNTSGTDNISLSGFSFPDNSEGDREKTFSISLRIITGAVFLGGETQRNITMTIVDDDLLRLTPSVSSTIVKEDAGEFVVNYSLSNAISSDVTFKVRLSNANRPGYGNARKNVDYGDIENETITIPPGETSGSISIPIFEDSITEPLEAFKVEFYDLSHGTFPVEDPNNWTTLVSIDKNDLPTLSITNNTYTVLEDAGTFDLNLMTTQLSVGDVAYKLHYLNQDTDTAVVGTHYHQDSQRQIFSPGETTKIFPIQIIDAPSTEGNKTFTFSLEILSGAVYPTDAQTIDGEKRIVRTVTIIDDEPPAVEITNEDDDFTLAENAGNLVINYVLGNATTHNVTFEYNLIDVTTLKNSDYTEADDDEREITIEAGRTSGSFSIPIIDDSENEGNETFKLVISELTGASVFLGDDIEYIQTVTIVDNEPPTLSIANSELSVDENTDARKIDIEVSLSGPTTDQSSNTNNIVTLDYALNDVSATKGVDYTEPISRRISIQEGETTATFSIPILDDSTQEGNETFSITMNITTGAKFDDGLTTKTQTITIFDDELPTLSFQTAPIKVLENIDTTELVVGVQLSGIPHQDVTFDYNMVDVSTTKSVDYIEESIRTATISAGNSSGTFTIPVIDDLLNEGNETFTLTLSNLSKAEFAVDDNSISKTVTIQDNELPILSVTTEDFTIDEDDSESEFVLNFELSGPIEQDVSFDFDLMDVSTTKGSDYTEAEADDREITISEGETSGSFSVQIVDDSSNEGDETFALTLSNLSSAVFESRLPTFSTDVKIIDDELPTLSIATTNFEVFEDVGSGSYVVEFELSGATSEDVTFDYALSGGTATKGTDYTEAEADERTLTIAGGDTTKTISILITDDTTAENNETFTLTLSNLSGAVFANGTPLSETITILDNESISLSITTENFSIEESVVGTDRGNTFVVNVALSEVANLDVTFDYDLMDVLANKGVDYLEATDRTVTISAGQTTGSFPIQILDDLELEGSQSFTLVLSNLRGAIFANNATTISKEIIIVDDETPEISITTTNFEVAEEANNIEISVSLLETSLDNVKFNYTTTNITAEKGLDYTDSSGKVTIEAGDLTGSFSIPIIDDSDHERSESFRIDLVGQGHVQFESTHTSLANLDVTILDNEVPVISIADGPMVTESDVSGSPAYARFPISTAVAPVTNNFTIQYTPTSPNFVANSGTLTTSHALDFSDADNDGIYTAELRVEIVSDSQEELNGNLEVSLNVDTVGSEKYYVNSAARSATVFVVDDDAAIPELSLESISTPIAESAGNVVFTIIASEAPGREVTVHYTVAEIGDSDFLTDAVATTTSGSIRFQNIAGREKGTISVDLDNDIRAEPTGMIELTLNADSAPSQTYTVVAGAASSATATILDNDAPTLSITGWINGYRI